MPNVGSRDTRSLVLLMCYEYSGTTGKWAWMIVVHSVTRGWQDISILLGVMGETQLPIHCPIEGCLVTSLMMSNRHFSKTYCRKATPSPLAREGWDGGREARHGGSTSL